LDLETSKHIVQQIRPLNDLKFIINNYTTAEERAPQVGDVPIHHSPIHHPKSSAIFREDRILEQM